MNDEKEDNPFKLLSKTDAEIRADCEKYVDERIADRKKAVDEGRDPSMIDFIGCMGYGMASEPRDVQIESGFNYFKQCQERDKKTKAEWDRVLAKWEGRLILEHPPYGNCPVQCDGTFDGLRLYFRARWESWRLDLNEETVASAAYGDSEFASGWMEPDEALRFIDQGLDQYTR